MQISVENPARQVLDTTVGGCAVRHDDDLVRRPQLALLGRVQGGHEEVRDEAHVLRLLDRPLVGLQ
jgi:hypothetical protein